MITIRSRVSNCWWSMIEERWTPDRTWATKYDTFADCPEKLPSCDTAPGVIYRTGPGYTEGYFSPGHGQLLARPEEVEA